MGLSLRDPWKVETCSWGFGKLDVPPCSHNQSIQDNISTPARWQIYEPPCRVVCTAADTWGEQPNISRIIGWNLIIWPLTSQFSFWIYGDQMLNITKWNFCTLTWELDISDPRSTCCTLLLHMEPPRPAQWRTLFCPQHRHSGSLKRGDRICQNGDFGHVYSDDFLNGNRNFKHVKYKKIRKNKMILTRLPDRWNLLVPAGGFSLVMMLIESTFIWVELKWSVELTFHQWQKESHEHKRARGHYKMHPWLSTWKKFKKVKWVFKLM